MDISTQLTITEEECKDLAAVIGCETKALPDKLAGYAAAALEDYVSMMLGKKVFKRGSDMLEYRLFLLIERVYDHQIPDEQEVCRVFQVTATESRSLIRSVMSKYQYQLKAAIKKSMKRVVENAASRDEGQPFTVTIANKNIVDALNVHLAEEDGSLQPVSKKRGSVSDYEISRASYQALKEILGKE